ncbi:MAG: ketoacyl-ACP synthase III [Alphaproteobacteria bacterium]|nr:ketoacyl-ACP synthase III [Alphaproteobacteria bacterium]
MLKRSIVMGCGSFLPDKLVSNKDLEKDLDTSDSWIQQRTGIRQRFIASDNQLTSHLAIEAARKALFNASIDASEIDLIVLATATPDRTFPATAVRVQSALGIQKGAAFDVQAVCSGFIYALAVADNFLKLGQAKTALVIGAEVFSRILDWQDRRTCVLFGDGAGALILQAKDITTDKNNLSKDDRGVLSTHLYSDGRYEDLLYVDGGPASTNTVGKLRMAGKEVFKHAVQKMGQAVETALLHNNLSVSDIDWWVPHQANKRIIDSIIERMHISPEKMIITVDQHANTSAASIPLALTQAVEDGRIKPGHLVLLEAMGGGFTWGSALLRW